MRCQERATCNEWACDERYASTPTAQTGTRQKAASDPRHDASAMRTLLCLSPPFFGWHSRIEGMCALCVENETLTIDLLALRPPIRTCVCHINASRPNGANEWSSLQMVWFPCRLVALWLFLVWRGRYKRCIILFTVLNSRMCLWRGFDRSKIIWSSLNKETHCSETLSSLSWLS